MKPPKNFSGSSAISLILLLFFLLGFVSFLTQKDSITNLTSRAYEVLENTKLPFPTPKPRKLVLICESEAQNSPSKPCNYYQVAGLQEAIDKAERFTDIIVYKGVYPNARLYIGVGNHPDIRNLRILGDNINATFDGGVRTEGQAIFTIGGDSSVVIRGVTMKNAWTAVHTKGKSRVKVAASVIEGQSEAGILSESQDEIKLRRNYIRNNPQTGILIRRGTATIENNLIYNNSGPGVSFISGKNIALVNNLFYNNTGHGVTLSSWQTPSGHPQPEADVRNNIFAKTKSFPFDATIGDGLFNDPNVPVKLNASYNLFWANESTCALDEKDCTRRGSLNNVDPKFVNETTFDFHLQVGSPAINAGDPALEDHDDYSRSDMGPYGGPLGCSLDQDCLARL